MNPPKKTIKQVLSKRGTGKELAKMFKVSEVTVTNALRGKSNSPLAARIRKAAVNKGGTPIYEN